MAFNRWSRPAIWICLNLLIGTVAPQVGLADPAPASSSSATPPPLKQPLDGVQLAETLRQLAERDEITWDRKPLNPADRRTHAGDSVVIWAGASDQKGARQWLIQLSRGTATSEEIKKHPPEETSRFLSWGSVVKFSSQQIPLDLWIAGPIDNRTASAAEPDPKKWPKVHRVRIFVPHDYLLLGLDNAGRANFEMQKRVAEKVKADPKFPVGHLYFLGHPIKPENVALAKPVATQIGMTPEIEQNWVGGHVALQAFYELINAVDELREIAEVAVDRPSILQLSKLAFGSHLMISLWTSSLTPLDAERGGFFNSGADTYELHFNFGLDAKPITEGAMLVTAAQPPLDVSAGILGAVAVHPKDSRRVVQLIVLSARAGQTK